MVLAATYGRREMLAFLLDNYQNLFSPHDSSKVGIRGIIVIASYSCVQQLLS